MPTAPSLVFDNLDGSQLLAMFPEKARRVAVNIAPSKNYVAGTILGELTGTNAVWTITISSGTSGGTFTLSSTLPAVLGPTGAIAWSATNATLLANIQAACDATFGVKALTAAAASLTAGIGTITLTAGNNFGYQVMALTLADSTTGGTGTTIATTTTGVPAATTPSPGGIGGVYAAYASGNSDGTQIPKIILAYDITTDANGNITYTGTSGNTAGGEFGNTEIVVQAFVAGYFRVQKLTGLDANAISVLQARYIAGNLTNNGIISFGA